MVVFYPVDDVWRRWVTNGGGVGAGVRLEVFEVDDSVVAKVGGEVEFVDDVRSGF